MEGEGPSLHRVTAGVGDPDSGGVGDRLRIHPLLPKSIKSLYIERLRLPESHAQSSGDLRRSAVRLIPGDPDQEIRSQKMRQAVIKDGSGGGVAAAADLTLNLPSELLQLIASKLTNICDYIRFRSVCIRWRSSADTRGRILPHRWLPLLILPLTLEGDFLPVFNTADCRFYNLPLPEEVQSPLNTVTGSAYGWLVILDSHHFTCMKVYLYNPITRSCIHLPPIPFVLASTAHLCCNPTTASPGQLLLSITCNRKLMPMLIYRQGDVCWTEIEMPPGFTCYTLVTYLEEEATIYAATLNGILAVLDLASLTFRILIRTSSPEIKSLMAYMNLVSSSGDLFFVASDDPRDPRSIFKLLKLERDKEGGFKWVRATTLGDRTLFVTHVDSVTVICDQGSFAGQTNLIYDFRDFSNPGRDENGLIAAVRGRIQVWDLIAGVKHCFEIISKRIKYKNLHLHKFTWMVPNMS